MSPNNNMATFDHMVRRRQLEQMFHKKYHKHEIGEFIEKARCEFCTKEIREKTDKIAKINLDK